MISEIFNHVITNTFDKEYYVNYYPKEEKVLLNSLGRMKVVIEQIETPIKTTMYNVTVNETYNLGNYLRFDLKLDEGIVMNILQDLKSHSIELVRKETGL